MPASQTATRVMIFFSEGDRIRHHGLHEELVNRAREDGLAGATVWKGIEGFGTAGHFRTARFPDAAVGLPLVLELIDAPERIEAFLSVVQDLAPGSFVTREQVQVTRFGVADSTGLDDHDPQGTHRP